MKREFLDYIEDIIEAMEDCMDFVKDTNYDDFVKNKMNIYAVIRAIEAIGEVVKRYQFL
ncbi:MAG: HepT-like ribonuclease domain-containing protein [Thermoproteota archaeon]